MLVGSSSSSTFAPETTSVASASRVFSPPDSTPAGLSTSSPENRNEPSTLRTSVSSRSGRGATACSPAPSGRRRASRAPARSSRAAARARRSTSPVSGCVDAGQHPQQRGLAGAVEPEHDDPAPRSMARSTSVKISSEPYDLDSPLGRQRRPAARRRRRGSAAWRPCPALRSSSSAGQQPLGPPGHVLRGDRLGRLGAHLVGLGHQRGGLLLGVGPLALAAPLVGLALRAGTSSSRRCRRRSRPGWRPGGRPC